MVKKIVSGGDEIQARQNYMDEKDFKIQTTFFMHTNDFPSVEPIDALKTMLVFEFHSAYHPKDVIDARMEKDDCHSHWKVADSEIKTKWTCRPDIIDAFTMMVLDAYESVKLPPPECVKKHTANFCEAASMHEIDRFREVVSYTDIENVSDVFVDEIKIALDKAGLKKMSTYKIGMYIDRLYGKEATPPVKVQLDKSGKRGYGFRNIILNNVVAFDAREVIRTENLIRNEQLRQQVRNGGEGVLGKRSHGDMEWMS